MKTKLKVLATTLLLRENNNVRLFKTPLLKTYCLVISTTPGWESEGSAIRRLIVTVDPGVNCTKEFLLF